MTDELRAVFTDRPFVIQAFQARVQSEGEFSLFFFAGRYSHAVRKLPANADFRVQEQYGAHIVACEPGQGSLVAAEAIIGLGAPTPVYARIDLVRGNTGKPLLMELELIEPSFYVTTDPATVALFADRFTNWLRRRDLVGGLVADPGGER